MAWYDIFTRSNKQQITKIEERGFEGATNAFNDILSNEGPVTSLSAVFAATEIISNSLAELPIIVKVEGVVDSEHPYNHLFCNGLMSRYMLIKQLVWDILIYNGNAFLYIKRDSRGAAKELVYCKPSTVQIYYNEQTQELYYTCNNVQTGKIQPKDMIHLYKNSQDGVHGRSVISYAKNIFDLAKYADKTASNYYKSGCNIDGILKVSGNPSQEEIEKIRMTWRTRHGVDGNSSLCILKGNMDYQAVGASAQDSQLLEVRNFNVTEIARFFNISPVLLGDLTKSSYSTIEASQLEFVQHTLYPYIAIFESELNRKLCHRSNVEIDFDESFLLKTDKSVQASYLNTLVGGGILTVNEARAKLGLLPVEGGDSLIIPYTKIEDNTVGSTDGKEDVIKEDEV